MTGYEANPRAVDKLAREHEVAALTLTQIAVRIVGLVFVTELGVMLVQHFVIPRLGRVGDAVVDSLLLSAIVTPFVVLLLKQRRRAELEREAVIQELQHALAKVRTLSGLLPICANCKKIRDDGGYWSRIEVYVRDHSDAEFSHSLCPPCARTLYGEFADEVDGNAPPQRRRLDPRGLRL
jgi:hypothetical protein